MRIVTFEHSGREKAGMWLGDQVIDFEPVFSEFGSVSNTKSIYAPRSMIEFLKLGDAAMSRARAFLERAKSGQIPSSGFIPIGEVLLKAPIPRPGKILAVDYNYPSFVRDARIFLAGQGVDVPEWKVPAHPWIFGKFSTTVIGSGATIFKPVNATMLDAEGELAIVIGKTGRFVPKIDAPAYIAGFTLFNDISDRKVEFRPSPSINHRLYVLGKNNDTFGPLGPCLFTQDELGDIGATKLEVLVNGVVLYGYHIAEAVYDVADLVSFCSDYFLLEPGDVIAMGSGGGCGAFRKPPQFLKPGDNVQVKIPGLPPLENVIEDERL